MSTRQRDALLAGVGGLRYEPIGKRIRATLGDDTVLDTVAAVLVWEPRRVVPEYAVPPTDLNAELVAASGPDLVAPADGLLFPNTPFAAHTAAGHRLDVRAAGQTRESAAFRIDDKNLDGLVVLDFDAFDSWYQEDEQNVGHPRDPFHRLDALPSSRHVRVELDGEVLAESTRPVAMFEAMLPPRWYLPRDDVRVELEPTGTHTWCAYKGEASYWAAVLGERRIEDVAWGYPTPLNDAELIGGLIAFDDSKVTVIVD